MIFSLVAATLLCGSALSFPNHWLILYYAAYYGLCVFALKAIDYGGDFFKSFAFEEKLLRGKKVILAGEEIGDKIEEDKQEDRFLSYFETKKIIKRRVLTWCLFFGGLWFFHFKQGIEFGPSTAIPLLSCVLIVNSFYVGHFLVALFLNLIMVIYAHSNEIPLAGYFVYGGLFFNSLYLIGTRKENLERKKMISKLGLASLFLVMTFGFSRLLPDKNPDLESEIPPQKNQMIQHQLRNMKVDLGKMNLKIPSPKNQKLLEQMTELENQLRDKNISASEKQILQAKLKDVLSDYKDAQVEFKAQINLKSPKLTGEEKEALSGLKKRSQSPMRVEAANEELTKTLASMSKIKAELDSNALSQGEQESLTRELENLSNQASALKEPDRLTQREKQALQDIVSRHQTEDTQEIQRLMGKGDLSQDERLKLVDQVERLDQLQDQQVGVGQASEEEMLNALKEEKENHLGMIERLKKLLPVLLAAFLFILINYLLRKKGIKKIEARDPEVLKELQEEWSKLKKLKLSPREEVIHYYNLFHETLQKIHYSSHEAPPSCIIKDDMREFHPVLEKSTVVITEVFAQCYYGEKNVTPDALKLYRKAMNNVQKIYQLT